MVAQCQGREEGRWEGKFMPSRTPNAGVGHRTEEKQKAMGMFGRSQGHTHWGKKGEEEQGVLLGVRAKWALGRGSGMGVGWELPGHRQLSPHHMEPHQGGRQQNEVACHHAVVEGRERGNS